MFFGKRFSSYHDKGLSGLEVLVLSLIRHYPRITGYDIIGEINKRFNRMWKASPGTIYPLLDRLAKKALVEAEEIVDENNRRKKVYIITEEGREVLKHVLKGNFEDSLRTLGKYIQTISRGFNLNKNIEHVFSCFPYCDSRPEIEFDETDYSQRNLSRIKNHIHRLEHRKEGLTSEIDRIEQEIDKYKDLVRYLETKREEEKTDVPIIEDDKEFENF